MGVGGRKIRERAERQDRIVTSARQIAENEGWDAVTIRRLASEIEYSQPVLYSHFANRDAIVAAVAVEGFKELTSVLKEAAGKPAGHQEALSAVSAAYFDFARHRPAIYEAMFVLPVELHFAQNDTRSELHSAFQAMTAAVSPFCTDVDTVTETFWAALHGLAQLEASGRIRPSMHHKRVAFVVQAIVNGGTSAT
jgi:AcrR family transcriptional regulator